MIKLTKPYIPTAAIQQVVKVIESGQLVQGQYVKTFEDELAQYLGVKHVIVVANGTAALHISLLALGIKEGDEVIVPAFTYPATANVVELVGAKTILVDVNSSDLCMDTSQIENAITSKTKAILPVHEFGQSAKMDDILAIAKKHNLFVVEDAACALGTEFNGKKVGTFGNIGCFSFHPRKAITTGEGGAIVTNDDNLASIMRSLRNHGIAENGKGKYDFIYAGLNYRMTDFQAALGLHQFFIIEEIIKKRIETAASYSIQLQHLHWLSVPSEFKERRMVFQTYHILLNDTVDRDAFIKYLKDNGIETNFGAYALCSLSYYRSKYGFSEEHFPNAVMAYNKGVALPLSYELSSKEINFITETITQYRKVL